MTFKTPTNKYTYKHETRLIIYERCGKRSFTSWASITSPIKSISKTKQ